MRFALFRSSSQRAPLMTRRASRTFPCPAAAALVRRLSDTGGDFDTDNLISNESSYLHPLSTLERLGVRGGAYIGVGPDQNFSLIARVNPSIAFITDIRRDNLLHHLLFKALFEQAQNRTEYVALWLGRAVPSPRRPAPMRRCAPCAPA